MSLKLLAKQLLEFLSLTGGYRGSSGSTLVKMPHCWKSHVAAQLSIILICSVRKGPKISVMSNRGNKMCKTAWEVKWGDNSSYIFSSHGWGEAQVMADHMQNRMSG